LHKAKTVVDMGKFRLKTVVVAGGCWFTLALEQGPRIRVEPLCDCGSVPLLEGFHLEMAVLHGGPYGEVNVQGDISGPVIKCMQCYNET
jgi:hypothetical protein